MKWCVGCVWLGGGGQTVVVLAPREGGVRSAGPHGLGSTLASKKERRSGLQITLRHTDTKLQRLTRRSAFRMYTFSTHTRLGGCRPADCLLMFGPRWSRLCCSCPMAPLAERLHNSVTLYSFSSGIAAIPSHPWLSLTSEHGGGGAPCRQKTLTISRKHGTAEHSNVREHREFGQHGETLWSRPLDKIRSMKLG